MNYKMISAAFDFPIDKDRQCSCVRHYSDGKFFAAMYSHGTWVFPGSDGDRIEDGNRRLAAVGQQSIGFTVREMDDGNFIVGFNDHVFAVVLQEELKALSEKISLEIASFSGEGEQLLGLPNAPREHLYVGLLGRTRLLHDIMQPQILVSLSPKE